MATIRNIAAYSGVLAAFVAVHGVPVGFAYATALMFGRTGLGASRSSSG